MLTWIAEQGVRWQPSLGGTLSLGRTNSFFLGGGRAMLNALYLTAEASASRSPTRPRCIGLDIEDGMFLSADREQRDGASACAPRAGRGGRRLRGQHRMAEAVLGRGGRQLPDPRHAATIAARSCRCCSTRRAGDRRPDAVPRGRDRRARAEIRRRHHHAPRLRGLRHRREQARRSASTTRARTSGRSATPSGAGSSRAQPDQIAYIIFDAPSLEAVHAVALPADRRADDRANSPASSSSIRPRCEKTVDDFNAAVRPGTFDHTILDDCRTEGLDAAEDALGAAHRDARPSTPIRCGPASPSPISARA